MLEFKAFRTATSIFAGIETMHIIKMGQLILRDKPSKNEVKFIYQLFGMVAQE